MLLQQNQILNCFTGSPFIKALSSLQFWVQAVRLFRKLLNQGIDFMQTLFSYSHPHSNPQPPTTPTQPTYIRTNCLKDKRTKCSLGLGQADAFSPILFTATGHLLHARCCAKYLWTRVDKLWSTDQVQSTTSFCMA
jgi:hypothetical protein